MGKIDYSDKFNKGVCICDSTLKEGLLYPGLVLSNIEKYKIASLLDEAGVSQIECGIPAMGGDERVAVEHIANMGLNASIMAASKATAKDVEASLVNGVDSMSLSIPTSDYMIEHKLKKDRAWVLGQLSEAISLAKKNGLYVTCCAEDASRTDLMFLIEFAKLAKESGADRLRYCDTLGKDNPFNVFERIESIRKIVGIDIEINGRNDYGMANAVTMLGIKAGAKFATTTIMGIGERAGCAALEEVVMTAEKLMAKNTGVNLRSLKPLAEFVSHTAKVPIHATKPFLGTNCFAYEFGAHSDAVNNDNNNDEPYDPDLIGLQRKTVIGRNTGTKVAIAQLSKKGIEITRDDADRLLIMIRKATVFLHRSLTDEELVFLYEQMMKGGDPFDEKINQVVE